jgi:hypothetical protein
VRAKTVSKLSVLVLTNFGPMLGAIVEVLSSFLVQRGRHGFDEGAEVLVA